MENLKLNEQEQRLYADLFSSCDVESCGKVPGVRATELFLTSGLPRDSLFQVAELCGAKRLGHFGRSQFYIALKLIAAAQIGLPVSLESLNSGDVPLPNVKARPSEQELRRQQQQQSYSLLNQTDQDRNVSNITQTSGGLPPPPATRQHSRSFSGTRATGVLTVETNIQQNQNNSRGTSPHTKSPPFSPKDSPSGSPGTKKRLAYYGKQQSMPAQLHGVYSNATNNSTANYDNANKSADKSWTSFEEEDHQGLLTQEQKDWAHFSDHHKTADTSSITSSEGESIDDVWIISDVQREYYINQFKIMQTDLTGVIGGATAKEFFEKSKLPVHELSRIWQLSDVNKDGALSLEEFCTAMHLVVLRRNDVELPEKLPPTLMPYVPLVNDEPFAADLPPGGTLKRLTPTEQQNQQWAPNFPHPPESASSSAVSSPGAKPVNFDYKPVTTDTDSKIVHPVAVRMSPDGMPLPTPPDVVDRGRTFSDPAVEQYSQSSENILSPTKMRSATDGFEQDPYTKYAAPLHGRPRPTPKKAQSVAGASLGQLAPPPAVPPRASPKDAPGYRAGAGDMTDSQYKDTSRERYTDEELEKKSSRQGSNDKQALQSAIRRQRERNTMLSRLNFELNQELQEVMEQRIALEIQLEHLRPFSS